MEPAPDALPDDIAALRALIVSERAERLRADAEAARLQTEAARLQHEVARLTALTERLDHIIAQLRRLQFGRRSEALDPDQLKLGLEDLESAAAEVEAEEEKGDPDLKAERTRRRREGRPSLPDHLPQVEMVIEPRSMTCPCCAGSLHRIGEDVSRRLDVVPAQYRILVIRRPRYACRGCEGAVVQAPAQARLIEGGLPTERLVAQVLVDKYADHCPLYRQVQGFARHGIELDRSTLAFWTGYAAAELKPLWRWMREDLLRSGRLFVDETRAPVLDPGRGRTRTGYLWAIVRDDRGWGGSDPPAVVYTYAPGRGADHAIALLRNFTGILQTDGYGAYKALVEADRARGAIALAHCWAHARRRFFELAKGGAAPIADEALRRIAGLYAVEAGIRGQDADTRKAARQERSRPLTLDLKQWLEARLTTVAGRSPLAEAIRYTLARWDGLTRFLDDGRIELDSNTVERSIRPIALNRKNALFAGSDEGAENWAVLATLIECCKLHGVNPNAYLTDVLTRLVNGHLESRLGELTPWAWQAANTQH
ncbi:MAG: IS66 family transposase [Geminicoccaceae bacterium]